jgi:hypothetical protein
MAAARSGDKTFVVIRPNYEDEEVSGVARVEFIAGQNRVTFYDADGDPVGSFEGQGIDFKKKS